MPKLPSAMPLSGALDACADELAALASRCEQLQAGLAPALQGGAAIEEAQTLDLVTQSLGAIAGYLAELAAALPAGWVVDPRGAAGKVPLAAMAERLGGLRGHNSPESGEAEFFGGRP